jgi:murein DD-endopeptidase MepM/ murein hydrolase activator NlpD
MQNFDFWLFFVILYTQRSHNEGKKQRLAADRQHHTSKRNRYTLLLVHDEDASKAKSYRLALWQFTTGFLLFAVLAVVLVVLVLTYTPVGQVFPLSNKGLENKYSKELVSLNQRMTNLMEQLVELRTYNIKLRRAFGENIAASDSGVVKLTPRTTQEEIKDIQQGEKSGAITAQAMNPGQRVMAIQPAKIETEPHGAVAFPAILPTEGYLTRGFEPENNHYGLDIAGKIGTLIIAAADGNVVFSGWTYNDGYVVIVSHTSGFMSFYKHNQSILKSAGSFVRRGEPIATLGTSGTTSSGPHLHFEIWKDGVPVDPSVYMINYYL